MPQGSFSAAATPSSRFLSFCLPGPNYCIVIANHGSCSPASCCARLWDLDQVAFPTTQRLVILLPFGFILRIFGEHLCANMDIFCRYCYPNGHGDEPSAVPCLGSRSAGAVVVVAIGWHPPLQGLGLEGAKRRRQPLPYRALTVLYRSTAAGSAVALLEMPAASASTFEARTVHHILYSTVTGY